MNDINGLTGDHCRGWEYGVGLDWHVENRLMEFRRWIPGGNGRDGR